MAEKSGHDKSTNELRAEIASSRERVSRDLRGLHYELDFSRKIAIVSRTNRFLDHSSGGRGALVVLLPVREEEEFT